MTVDFTKFPYPGIENTHAATLTEAIMAEPVTAGFAVLTIKQNEDAHFVEAARAFAHSLRSGAATSGVADVTLYREFRRDELGGAMPFDQAICEAALDNARRLHAAEPDRYPTVEPALKMAERNDIADWTILVEFENTDQATAAVAAWNGGAAEFAALTRDAKSTTIGAFRNMKRYAEVSRDPNVIQFFNFFPGPGSSALLWEGWQHALPWFFEAGEMRSSFPLQALNDEQPILIVNYAHFDSIKHFFLGVAYDPNYLEDVKSSYIDRGFKLPMPFFCKIVPI